MASKALPKTNANTTSPLAFVLQAHPRAPAPTQSKFEGGGEGRSLHVRVETEIKEAACRVVKVEGAITQLKIEPRIWGVVDCTKQLPVAMRAEAKAADVAIGS